MTNKETSVGDHMDTVANAGLKLLTLDLSGAGREITNQVRADIGGIIGGVRSMIGNVLGGGLNFMRKGLGLIPLPVPGVHH